MGKEPQTRNVLITFDISSIAGRDQLAGVLRYLREKPNWVPRIISRAADFTPEIVRNVRDEHIDGIIINHVGSPETEDALAASDIPVAAGFRNANYLKDIFRRRFKMTMSDYRAAHPAAPQGKGRQASRKRRRTRRGGSAR